MIRPAQHVLLGQGRAAEPEAEAPTGLVSGTTNIQESTTLTLERPGAAEPGTYYAWIMHRDILSLPEGWSPVASQDVANQDLNQKLTVAKAPATVADVTFLQASAQRFAGVILETEGGANWVETIESSSLESINAWHDAPSVTPPGNGIVMSGSCGTIANGPSSDTYYLSVLRQETPLDTPGNRLCVGTGNVVSGNLVSPQFRHEAINDKLAEITITLTDGAGAPPEMSRTPFITKWRGGELGEDNIVLPLVAAGAYDFIVDWGFGAVDRITSHDDPANAYPFKDAAAEYQVKIYGVCDRWSFGDVGTARDSFRDVMQWGDVEWATCANMFEQVDFDVSELTATDPPSVSSVTDFSYMFAQSNGLTVAPAMDLSGALTVARMFYLSDVEETPYYNTSNCEDFGGMFMDVGNLASFGGLDTSSALEMDYMFNHCEGLTSVSLNTNTVENFTNMFTNNQSIVDCGTLDFSNATSTINPFNNTTNLQAFRFLNLRRNMNLRDTSVTWAAISQLWEDLPTLEPGESHTIEIVTTPAVSDPAYDPQPAIDKGWTVIDS